MFRIGLDKSQHHVIFTSPLVKRLADKHRHLGSSYRRRTVAKQHDSVQNSRNLHASNSTILIIEVWTDPAPVDDPAL